MTTTAQRLRDSIRTGEFITIIYSAGSHSGELRQIVPIQMVEGDEKVKARCLIDGITKNFIIDKISIVDEHGVITHSAKYEPSKKYNDIIQLGEDVTALLAPINLHVNVTEDGITIHKVWKNGNPHKGNIMAIQYFPTSIEGGFTDDGDWDYAIEKPRERPWSVWGEKFSNSFKHFDKAASYFLENINKVLE
ncbi:hypothetical protein ACE02Z_16250 [Shewanella xiamenensis]|uniref:hypothetical protein n=1 Tax=Shewanella xiamenensis TaxID=332186 RepID=UPI00313B7021